MLSAETKEIVKATKPTLEQHGLAITSRLYERLFTEHPETEQLFAGSSPGQAARLADAVLAYADNIDNIEALVPVVEQIAAKHVAAGVQPAHYDIVGTALLRSMVDVLGELDIAVIEAWSEAYGVLSSVFISTEAEANLLAQPEVLEAEAQALADALDRWFTTQEVGSGLIDGIVFEGDLGNGGGLEGCVDPQW